MSDKGIELFNCRRRYLGVGYIKSRKSEDKIMEMANAMIDRADSKGLKLTDVIVDSTSATDIDRTSIDKLIECMERDDIVAIVVGSIYDITSDNDDLVKFLCDAEQLNVSVYSIEQGMNVAYIPFSDEGC